MAGALEGVSTSDPGIADEKGVHALIVSAMASAPSAASVLWVPGVLSMLSAEGALWLRAFMGRSGGIGLTFLELTRGDSADRSLGDLKGHAWRRCRYGTWCRRGFHGPW